MRRNIVAIPQSQINGDALAKIETLLESIVDAVTQGGPIIIPYRRSSNAQASHPTASDPNPRDGLHTDSVQFPGGNPQELRRFGQSHPSCSRLRFETLTTESLECLFRIIELCHEALLSGTLITKRYVIIGGHAGIRGFGYDSDRNIYYQNMELFRSQSVVDDMVDNLAFTLGLGRDDLNIVRIRQFSRLFRLSFRLIMLTVL